MNNHVVPRSKIFTISLCLATVGLSFFDCPSARAASAVWQNTGTDFNTGGNWSGGTGTGGIPGTGDNATFTGPEVSNPNLSASLTIQGLTFSTTTSKGYTLSASAGQSLTLTNVGTGATGAVNAANTSGTNTISAPLILGGAASSQAEFAQAAGGTLVISGDISSTNTEGILVDGAGTVTLSGSNSYTGGTTVSAGTLLLGNNAGAGTGAVTLSGGTLGASSGTVNMTNGLSATASTTSTIGGAGFGSLDLGLGSTLSGGGNITLGTSTLLIDGGNNTTFNGSGYTGTLTVSNGATFTLNNTTNNKTNVLNLQNAAIVLSGGGTINYSQGGTNNANSGTFQFGSLSGGGIIGAILAGGVNKSVILDIGYLNSSTTFSGTITQVSSNGGDNSTSLTKLGSGTFTLAGTNLYTGATTVQGGALVLSSTLSNTAVTVTTGTLQMNVASAINQNTLTVNNAASVVTENTTNALGGTAALTQSNGAVTLSSANNFSGATALSGGSLTLSNDAAIASSALTLSGGTLNLRSDTNNDTFSDASTSISASTAINVDKLSSGSGNTLKLGAVSVTAATTATLSVSNGDSYTLALGAVTQTPTTATTFTIANSSPLTLASFSTNSTATPELSFQGAGTATITGNILQNGGGALALDRSAASGTLILQGTSNMTGAVTITNGTIQTAVATNAFGSTSGISIGAAGTLALRGDSSTAFSNGSTNYPISVTASGATINVDQASSAAAGTTLTLGTVAINGAYTLNTTGADGVSLSLGAVTSNSTATANIAFDNTIASPGTLTIPSIAYTANTVAETVTFNGTGSTTVTGAISQNGVNAVGVTQNNASGTTTLSGANTYSGATTISAGALLLNNALAAQDSIVTISAGTGTTGANNGLQFDAGLGDAFTIGGLSGASAEALLDTSGANVALTIGNNNDTGMSYSGVLSGGGSLTKAGTGTQTLTGANTFTGLTSINNGTLSVNAVSTGVNAQPLGENAALDLGSASTAGSLQYSGGSSTLDKNITLGTAGGFVGVTTSGNLTLTGDLIGSGNLTVNSSGAGIVFLSDPNNSNSFTGNLIVTAGIVRVASTNPLNVNNVLSIGGNLNMYNSTGITIAGLNDISGAGGGTVNGGSNNPSLTLGGSGAYSSSDAIGFNGSGNLTVALTSGGSQKLSGNLTTFAGGVTVDSGLLTLSGDDTYTGATNVKGGELLVSGSLSGSSTVTVGNSASLGASAILAGGGAVNNVTVGAAVGNTGAEVEPGNGVAEALGAGTTLTTGTFTILASSTSTLALQVGRSDGTDQLSLGGDSSDKINATSVSLNSSGKLSLSLETGYTPTIGDVLYLIISGAVPTGTFASVNGSAIASNQFTFDGYNWQIGYDVTSSGLFSGGDDVAIEALSVVAVPEPGTWAMLLGGFGILAFWRKPRRFRS